MNWWDDLTNPINRAMNSNAFKAVFPLNALGQKGIQDMTGAMGINQNHGLNPADQMAIGGAVGGGMAGLGSLMGEGGAAGMSAPVMDQAGSTLGGGMGSPLNLGGPSMGSGGPSAVSQALQMMRMLPQGGGQQQPSSDQTLAKIYQMFPSLKPGSQFGQGPNVGGM